MWRPPKPQNRQIWPKPAKTEAAEGADFGPPKTEMPKTAEGVADFEADLDHFGPTKTEPKLPKTDQNRPEMDRKFGTLGQTSFAEVEIQVSVRSKSFRNLRFFEFLGCKNQ